MSELKLLLFGSPEIVLDGQQLTFESGKAVALLAYLGVTGQSHRRPELAALFWPESNASRARGALRYTLSLLRKQVPETWLTIDRQYLNLQQTANLQIDIHQFRKQVALNQVHNHALNETCPTCAEALIEAEKLYRGDFMQGFTLRDSPDFDEWQFFQMEMLRHDLAYVLERLVHYYVTGANYETALTYGRDWLRLDQLQEPVHRTLMTLYLASEEWSAAIRQYEQCKQILADEFGASPSPETEALYQQIRARKAQKRVVNVSGEDVVRVLSMPPKHNLPLPSTPFVGRQTELAELRRLLKSNKVPLLSIVGPGGIGKTRLALEVASALLDHFADGVYFVPFASLISGENVAFSLADAMGLTFSEGYPPVVQLVEYLRHRQLLLLLDNVEHLLVATEGGLLTLITDILEKAPQVKVLVTSRMRLKLEQERLYALKGLTVPQPVPFEGLISSETTLLNLKQYPALALFQQRSQQVQHQADSYFPGEIVRICQLTEGMPLAIELAAAMTNVLSIPAIATEIERNFNVLRADWPDVQLRHRSMQAVFDTSWHSLTVTEQTAIVRLSVFRGGFTYDAAVEVAAVSVETLTGLVNKSLLHHQSTGRYDIHELMRQYSGEKLAQLPNEKLEAEQRHRDFYVNLLGQLSERWQTGYHREALSTVRAEICNFRVAFERSLTWQDITILLAYTTKLWPFLKAQGHYSEAVEVIGKTLTLLEAEPNCITAVQKATYNRILGEAHFGLGQIALSHSCLNQALALVGQPLPNNNTKLVLRLWKPLFQHAIRQLWPGGIHTEPDSNQNETAAVVAAKIYDRIGYISYTTSNSYLGAYATLQGLNQAEINGPSPILALAYTNMSAFFSIIQQSRYADRYARLAKKVMQGRADLPIQAAMALRLCFYQGALGRWQQANMEGQRALRWFQQLEEHRNWGDSLSVLSAIALLQGDFRHSMTHCIALQALSSNNYNVEHRIWSICGQALNTLHLGQHEEALVAINDLAPLMEYPQDIPVHSQAAYYAVVAMAQLRAGNLNEALQAADQVVNLLRNRLALNIAIILFYNQVAAVYFYIWEQCFVKDNMAVGATLPHVQAQAQRICKDMLNLAWLFPMRGLFAYLRQGQYAWFTGKPRKAYRYWQKSLARAKKLAVPYVEASAHYQLGRHLPHEDVTRRFHLHQAKDIFQRLDASYDLAQVVSALTEAESIDYKTGKET